MVLCGVLVLCAAGAAAQETAVLTLQQAVDTALKNGDDAKILEGNLEVARAQFAGTVAKSSLSLSGTGSYGASLAYGEGDLAGAAAGSLTHSDQIGLTLSGPMTGVSLTASPYVAPRSGGGATATLGLSVSQTLWNGYPGGAARAGVEKARLALEGKELAAQASRLALVYRVKQAYYTMLAAQRALALKRDIKTRYDGILQQIQAVYDLQHASALDLRSAQYNDRSAEIDVAAAEHDLRAARSALANLLGRSPDDVFEVSGADDPEIPVATVEEALRDGLSRRVDIRQVELSRRSADVDLALASGQATPTVSLTGGANLSLSWGGGAGGTASAGVKVGLPILDSGYLRSQRDAARSQNDVYDAQVDQLTRSITADIRGAWENVSLQNQRVELARMNVETNDLQYRIVQTQHDLGTASNQDLINASVNQANAQTTLETARSAAQLAVLALLGAMGY